MINLLKNSWEFNAIPSGQWTLKHRSPGFNKTISAGNGSKPQQIKEANDLIDVLKTYLIVLKD